MTKKISGAEQLHALATHFAGADWSYTRLHQIKHIRYTDDNQGHEYLLARWKRGIGSLFSRTVHSRLFLSDGESWLQGLHYRWAYFLVCVRRDPHRPDGVLDHGSIITYWEEDGEYIQMVQPSVGELVAEFLIDQPDNPWAQKINAELERICEDYAARVKAGEVNG